MGFFMNALAVFVKVSSKRKIGTTIPVPEI